MTGLSQDQLLQALNLHFYNTNAILDHLQIQATTHATAAATSTVKKYIALPDGFDGHPKNWRVFKGQCETYIQANALAFQNDDDKKWFLLSHMNKGTALEIVNWIRSDLPNNFDNKSYAQFTSILAGLFEDPTERQTAMAKLDTLKQGGKGLVEFIAEFDLLVVTAGYKLPDHKEFLCHMFRTKINSRISDQLYNRGVAMDDYNNLKIEAIKADASNKARDNERRLQGISVGKGRPFSTTPVASASATKTSTGTTFGGQGQPMDLSQAKSQGLCFTCHQKGHISRNCPQKRRTMVRQMLGEMTETERAELLQVKEEKKEEAQGFQQPQQ